MPFLPETLGFTAALRQPPPPNMGPELVATRRKEESYMAIQELEKTEQLATHEGLAPDPTIHFDLVEEPKSTKIVPRILLGAVIIALIFAAPKLFEFGSRVFALITGKNVGF